MKIEEVTKKVKHYIAEDGKDFGEDKAGCELYEFENPYVKDMKKIPKLENIMFFYDKIDAYWCESQKDIDLCCHYFQECKRKENLNNAKKNPEMNYLDSLCVGRFLYPGYYFIIKLNSDKLDSYGMFSLSQMDNFWKVFLAQIPINPEAKERLQELQNKINEYASEPDNDIQNSETKESEKFPESVQAIFEEIKKESVFEQIEQDEKKLPKIYTSDNLDEYKNDKNIKEDLTNEQT